MKIHLVRSEEISTSRFRTIAEIIGKFKGPIEFIFRKEDISEDPVDLLGEDSDETTNGKEQAELSETLIRHQYGSQRLSWNRLFGYCDAFRQEKKIKSDEVVVLLTDLGNERNWFSAWEPSGKLDFFLQTSLWHSFIEAKSCFPIIYELAAIPLVLATCSNLKELEEMAHPTPRGCAFDLCLNKVDVQLKLRTGDICPDCRKKMIQKNIDPAIGLQVYSILDAIRSQMLFRERFQITRQPSRLEIDLVQRKLRFTDLGNVSVRLDPKEMTVYRFFLLHTEGVSFPYMTDYKEEIKLLYKRHSSTPSIATIESRVNAIVENSDDTLSGLITRINKNIRNTVGEEIAGNYLIQGAKGEKRSISLDRELLNIIDLSFRN